MFTVKLSFPKNPLTHSDSDTNWIEANLEITEKFSDDDDDGRASGDDDDFAQNNFANFSQFAQPDNFKFLPIADFPQNSTSKSGFLSNFMKHFYGYNE